MKDKFSKFLPVGSVVLLEGGTKRLMITGFLISPLEDKTKVYDYSGCLYPEGIIKTDQVALFNHNQIREVVFTGFSDEEEKNFKSHLEELLLKKQNENNVASNDQIDNL